MLEVTKELESKVREATWTRVPLMLPKDKPLAAKELGVEIVLQPKRPEFQVRALAEELHEVRLAP